MAKKETAVAEQELKNAEEQVTGAVAVQHTSTAVAVGAPSFEDDAGAGMEGADADSFAIPFLVVLQKGSPQVDPDHAAADLIEGAKPGMLFDNVTRELYDGKNGVNIIQAGYKRTFIRWGSDKSGEGFKGEISPEAVAEMRQNGEAKELENRLYIPNADGSVSEKGSDRLSDTRNHYIILVKPDGTYKEMLLSLSSTQIKKSKNIMAALASEKIVKKGGEMYTPPTFANIINLSTVPESNDQGSWHGVTMKIVGKVDRTDVYQAAKAFNQKVAKGAVTAKYDDAASTAGETKAEGF